jgi:hypothetical protein
LPTLAFVRCAVFNCFGLLQIPTPSKEQQLYPTAVTGHERRISFELLDIIGKYCKSINKQSLKGKQGKILLQTKHFKGKHRKLHKGTLSTTAS